MDYQYFYLLHIQYLGFRFHGWQKQPKLKTVHLMIDKTARFALGHENFKTMGCSRTDSKVSANHTAFELFLTVPVDLNDFKKEFNRNLPNDIRLLKIEEVDEKFNIINTSKSKQYEYYFCYGEKPHPFTSGLMVHFDGELDISKMQQGAALFEGTHDFVKYCTKPKPNTNLIRTINKCEIKLNTKYTANFFPEESYVMEIESKGFLRYQIRLIMGQLIRLGKNEISLIDIENSLKGVDREPLDQIAPGSGLILDKVTFIDS